MQQPGSVIDGKYEVLESLGQGGMGQVLLVRHIHLEERRVVKILRQDMSLEESSQKRFVREARLATQVKHPNVAILYDFSQLEDGRFYMVWEHIDGHHMGLRLQRKGPFAVLPALQLGIQTLRGLEAIHASGVVHRDISPDNLMITRDRRGKRLVKIIDLGLAKTLAGDPAHEVTQVGMFMGKLRYCSPEQAEPSRGQPLDRRSDLYSFGLVLYEALCGLEPFEAEMPHTAVMKRLSETPPPVSSRNPEVPLPAELDPIFEKALARDREERFANAVEFIEAIERVGFQLRQQDPVRYGASLGRPGRAKSNDETTTLTRTERLELLAQIQRAGSRKAAARPAPGPPPASTPLDARPPASPEPAPERTASEPETAAPPEPETIAPPEAAPVPVEPAPPAAPERSDRERREELEQMLTSYLKSQQLPLAELTLSTLLDLFPYHPQREEYEEWVRILRDEVDQGARAEETLAAGREALAEGRVRFARKRLAELRKLEPEGARAAALERELKAHETTRRDDASADELRSELDKSLDAGRLDDAQKALDALAETGTPRVTLDMYRSRLGDARREREQTVRAESFEARYREQIALGDWSAARDVALELERVLPIGNRPATMFAEISRLEGEARHLQALEQGVTQVESLLDAGDAGGARMALGILTKMDPDHPRRLELARRVAELDRAG
jgi:serine/threonine protein kinase